MQHQQGNPEHAAPVGDGAPLLSVQGVTVRFRGIVALEQVSFDVAAGQIAGLIGPNGAGKTTLFNCLSRLYDYSEGAIRFDGRSLVGLPRHRMAAIGLGRTFQNLALFRTMTVLDNIKVGRHCRTRKGFLANALRSPGVAAEEAESERRAHELDGLGDKAKTMIVAEQTYEVTDPTVDSQIVSLKGSGADTFFNITTPKFGAQAIRKVAEVGWKPVHYLNQVSASVGSVLKPAGLDNAVGLISMQYIKDPTDPASQNDPVMKDYFAFLKKYAPDVGMDDGNGTYGYAVAQLAAQVLKQAGDNLTRENIMKQAASLKKFQVPMAVPGILADTGPDDFAPFQTMQLVKFDGKTWVPYGKPVEVK